MFIYNSKSTHVVGYVVMLNDMYEYMYVCLVVERICKYVVVYESMYKGMYECMYVCRCIGMWVCRYIYVHDLDTLRINVIIGVP
ncbi:hypothetical protein HanIR_Chr16g0840551 [Helianthus annuus]|nr:hypothetical protein HanIR_Chr16g0840551 [Helianthus annuus]